MVDIFCPTCKSILVGFTHSSYEERYAKNAPDVPVGSMVSSICYYCKYRYSPGDKCQLRTGRSTEQFVVRQVISSNEIVVEDECGNRLSYTIVDIRPVDGEKTIEPGPSKDRKDYF